VSKYVLDSNIYIHATRDDAWSEELESFMWTSAPFVYLHSVVAGELLAGATNPGIERRTFRDFIEPLEDSKRVITPTHAAWKRAGMIVAKLTRNKRFGTDAVPRSFLNDCLLAASARDAGFAIVTRNLRDFDLIRTVMPVKVYPPWPT
jgi:predicted nucleic acid-binding protein